MEASARGPPGRIAQVQKPFVRAYDPSVDFDAMINIFEVTADRAIHKSSETLHIGSHIWCRPYLTLSSAIAFVLDPGTSSPSHAPAVGYILGSHSTPDYCSEFKSKFLPLLKDTLPPRLEAPAPTPLPTDSGLPAPDASKNTSAESKPTPVPPSWETDLEGALLALLYNADDMLHAEYPSLMEKYPAHLHIDLLPEWQGKGWGRQMMARYLETVKEKGASGIHLLMVEGNLDKAGVFYEKVGFKRYEEVVDGGLCGETGRGNGTIWLVREV